MQNKLQNLFNNNQDLIRIVAFGLAGIAIFAFIVIVFHNATSDNSTTYVDPISGETINTVNTGAIPDAISFIGTTPIIDGGLDVDIFNDAKERLTTFLQSTMPQITKLSYRKDSFSADNNNYSFELVSDDDRSFNINISGTSKYDYSLSVYYQGETILSYNASNIAAPTKDPSTLDNLLPHTIQDSNPIITVTTYGRGTRKTYEIAVDSCGDQSIKSQAATAVNTWLRNQGYDPDSFAFTIPDYCDNSAQ